MTEKIRREKILEFDKPGNLEFDFNKVRIVFEKSSNQFAVFKHLYQNCKTPKIAITLEQIAENTGLSNQSVMEAIESIRQKFSVTGTPGNQYLMAISKSRSNPENKYYLRIKL